MILQLGVETQYETPGPDSRFCQQGSFNAAVNFAMIKQILPFYDPPQPQRDKDPYLKRLPDLKPPKNLIEEVLFHPLLIPFFGTLSETLD